MKRTVCGLDVHKDSVFCCILCKDGRKIQHKFGVLTEDLVTLRDLMGSEDVDECAMESTSIYWMPIWRVLEGSVKLHLVNPYFIRQLPGKKSDVNDAEWIATCLGNNLIASSFVPDEKIQRLRQYDRDNQLSVLAAQKQKPESDLRLHKLRRSNLPAAN